MYAFGVYSRGLPSIGKKYLRAILYILKSYIGIKMVGLVLFHDLKHNVAII